MSLRLILFLGLCYSGIQAQAPRFFRHFTEKDGLSSTYVTCIVRDRSGFLWVGTNYGLNRYDGRQFKHYLPDVRTPDRTVSNEYINALAEDQHGFIWIATRNGLCRYDPKTELFKTWQNSLAKEGALPNPLITHIQIDENGLWLACDNRDLVFFDVEKDYFIRFPWKEFATRVLPETANQAYKTIYSLSLKNKDEWWLQTNLGVFSFNKQTKQFDWFRIPKQLPRADLGSLKNNCSQNYFFGSWDKDILYWDGCAEKWEQIALPIPEHYTGGFRNVTRVKTVGALHWVLSVQGIFLLDTLSGQIRPLLPDASNQWTAPTGNIQTIFTEPNGMLWIGGEKGLWSLDPAHQHFQFTKINHEDGESLYNRYATFLDQPAVHRRFIGDYYSGNLLVFEQEKYLKTIPLGGLTATLLKDEGGFIWVTGGHQLYQLDPGTLKLTLMDIGMSALHFDEKTIFTSLAKDDSGRIWIGTSNRGLIWYHPGTGKTSVPGATEGFISSSVNSLMFDAQRKTVWVGTDDYGLFRYDAISKHFTLYRHEADNPTYSLGAYMVRSICRDGRGYIWCATDPGGVSRFDYDAPIDKAFISFTTREGLPSNQVCALNTDRDGNIWAGTTKGLAWIDQNTLRLRSWSSKDGLQNEYIDLSIGQAESGEMMWSGKNGFESVFPDHLLSEMQDHRILLTSFKVFDQEYIGTFDSSITLHWRDNFFSVEFASAFFSSVEKNEYTVRLQGFDADWKSCGKRGYAAWTNVPPGDYVLEIRTRREGLDWPVGKKIFVYIEPPFWQKGWFIALATAAILALFGFLYKLRIQQVRREEQMKSDFNRRLAQVELSALRAQMNPHFVFNCLNSINRYILVNDPDAAAAYLTKFSRLIRLILDNSRSETVLLDKELDALRLYIELEIMRFNDHFDYTIDIEKGIQPEHIEVPPMLIQPYVENAIWHGLMHKKDRGQLNIRIFEQNHHLTITVEDNGIGRIQSQALKSKSAQKHKSHGMQLSSERIDMIRQLYGMDTSVVIEDLYAPDGSVSGTRVILTMYKL